LQTLRQNNPYSHIVVLGYYYVDAKPFVEAYGMGWSAPERIDEYNRAFFSACSAGGTIGAIVDLTCMRVEYIFEGLGNSHVVQQLNFTQYTEELARGSIEDANYAAQFEVYWRENPQGLIIGDGVHLSQLGKNILVDALINQLLIINPDL
jgi:hypothetical protein